MSCSKLASKINLNKKILVGILFRQKEKNLNIQHKIVEGEINADHSKNYLAFLLAASSTLIGAIILKLVFKNENKSNLESSLNKSQVFSSNQINDNFLSNFKKKINEFMSRALILNAKEEKPIEKVLIITPRQKLFFQFASIEYNGLPYMTPQDFLESVTEDHPRPRVRRKALSKENYEKFLKQTPGRKHGSSKLFRDMEERGLISYSEYLFLLCVITKPKSNFQIAFNMFDTDGNHRVDKKEFLVMTKIFQRNSEPKQNSVNLDNNFVPNNKLFDSTNVKENEYCENIQLDVFEHIDTSLMVHLFGQKGKDTLQFSNFKKFMEDLQKEVLEIEFNEFSKGMNKISPIEFAEILLRYTDFEQKKKIKLIRNLQNKIDCFSKGITFEKFYQFSQFMNNLEDFSLALKFHTQANKSISANEFNRAAKIASGYELDPQIVDVIFNVFDENSDGQLSYKEFIAVLKGRLSRGLKTKGRNQFYELNDYSENLFNTDMLKLDNEESFLKKYKDCLKKTMREN